MNFKTKLALQGQSDRLFWILVVFFPFISGSSATEYSDACRSIHGRIGTCVPLASCPVFSGWLKSRPVLKEHLRLIVKYTCYLDLKNPKVCCPNDNLYYPSEESVVGIRLGTPVRRGISNKSYTGNKLTFPETPLTFPHTSNQETANNRHNHNVQDKVPLYSSEKNHREHLPLTFPTDRYPGQSERGMSSSIWDSSNRNSKDPPIKDLRRHPNFRLIPTLHECSNAVKLDSNLGTYGAYPWIALVGIKRRRSLDFDHICSGVIISPSYILTVAHCFERRKPNLGYVRVGEYNLDTLVDQGSEYLPQSIRQDYQIEKITIHEHYNQTSGANDIALIRVKHSIALNATFIRAGCLPFLTEYGIEKVDPNIEEKPAWVAGWARHSWGERYSQGSNSSILLQDIVDFTSHEKCRVDYPHLSQFASRTQLCVGGKGKRNSCVPDSGGPLMKPLKVPSRVEGFNEPKFFTVGLLSQGPTGSVCQNNAHWGSDGTDFDDEYKDAASRSLPTSVFTRISKYLRWILDNMQE